MFYTAKPENERKENQMNKLKEIMEAVGRYTAGYVANHWKEFLTGLLGGLAASAATGCSSLVPSAKTQSMSLFAIGIPGIAVVTKSEQLSDNSGGDENRPVQVNPVTVEAKAK